MRELGERMDAAELCEWYAYERIHPPEDGYWQAALIASTVVNLWSGSKATLEDFLPVQREKRPQSMEEQKAAIFGLMALQKAQKRLHP